MRGNAQAEIRLSMARPIYDLFARSFNNKKGADDRLRSIRDQSWPLGERHTQ